LLPRQRNTENSVRQWRKQWKQISAVTDKPARCVTSRQMCCKQMWTLSVKNLRRNSCNALRFWLIASYLSKVANFSLSHLHLAPPLRVTPFEFCWDHWQKKTTVHGLSTCGINCTILSLAVSVEHWLMTDRDTTMAYTAPAWHRVVKIRQQYMPSTSWHKNRFNGHYESSATVLLPVTSPNGDRYFKFFHCETEQ